MSAEGIRRLDHVLSDLLPRSALATGLREQSVLDAWPEIVGEKIATHSEAMALANGTLFIAVESSVWAQELSLLRPRITAAIDAKLGPGHVQHLRFQSRSRNSAPSTLPERRG